MCSFWKILFGAGSASSYKISVVGNGWLVCNTVSSETAPRILVMFCMKLGDYKGRKVIEPDFWKTILDLEIFVKVSKLVQNQTLWYFSQKRLERFFWFCPEVSTKYDLQFEWNLFFRKICYLEILDLKNVKIWLFSYNLPVQFSCLKAETATRGVL